MSHDELCAWLRANSSGIYRPAAEAADEIERLRAALRNLDSRLRECAALGLAAAEAYDSQYQAETSEALAGEQA